MTERGRWARRAVAVAAAVATLAPLAVSQPALAKAKPAKKKAAATTARKAATTRKATATTAAPAANAGPAPSDHGITGMEIAPGAPIKIGIQVPGGGEAISGDLIQAYEIAFDTLRKAGQLPVYGRDVVLTPRKYTITDPTQAAAIVRGACTSLVQDDHVFAALTWAGPADCLAENKVPAIGSQVPTETMDRVAPYLFSFQWDTNFELQNVPAWADSLGLLKGRKLGIYHGTQTGRQRAIDQYFEPALRKVGYKLTADIGGGSATNINDPAADRVAVQRFKAADVDTIFLTTAFPGEFGKAAQAQGYKPKYIFGASETSIVCDGCPARANLSPELFNGSYALAFRRIGENGFPGNPPPTQAGVDCATTFEKLSGERTRQNGTASEAQKWQSIQWTCDGAKAVVAALKAAGPKLNQGTFIKGLESVSGIPSGLHFDYNWSSASHFSQSQVKTLQLEGDCLCWRTRSGVRAPYVAYKL